MFASASEIKKNNSQTQVQVQCFLWKALDIVPVIKLLSRIKPDSTPVCKSKRLVSCATLVTRERNKPVSIKAVVVIQAEINHHGRLCHKVAKCACSDYSTGLKKALDIHNYSLLLPEDIFTKFNGGTCFARLRDDAYFQFQLDDSKELPSPHIEAASIQPPSAWR